MKISDKFELPAAREADAVHAERLEWLTLAYLLSVIVLMYLVMGSSQTMKTAWIEDILSAIPPLAYLVADRVRKKPPDLRYPYGYHRAVTIAFLLAAFANLALGVYLAIDSAITLLEGQHPTIGSFHLFGRTIWLGWLMIAVLLWGVIPAFIIGRMKLPVARRLHDKTLHADADMNKADWLTGLAAIGGILGIGYGLWWADAVAALIISLDVIKDGLINTREVIGDLMDRRPQTVDHQPWTALPDDAVRALEALPWVSRAAVRLREHGHVVYGEAFVVPRDESTSSQQIRDAQRAVHAVHWQIHEVVIQPCNADDLPHPRASECESA